MKSKFRILYAHGLFIYLIHLKLACQKKGLDRSSKKHNSDNEKGLKTDIGLNRNQRRPERGEGNERKVHEQIIDRRISGGISITAEEIAEVYVQAQQQCNYLDLDPATN